MKKSLLVVSALGLSVNAFATSFLYQCKRVGGLFDHSDIEVAHIYIEPTKVSLYMDDLLNPTVFDLSDAVRVSNAQGEWITFSKQPDPISVTTLRFEQTGEERRAFVERVVDNTTQSLMFRCKLTSQSNPSK